MKIIKKIKSFFNKLSIMFETKEYREIRATFYMQKFITYDIYLKKYNEYKIKNCYFNDIYYEKFCPVCLSMFDKFETENVFIFVNISFAFDEDDDGVYMNYFIIFEKDLDRKILIKDILKIANKTKDKGFKEFLIRMFDLKDFPEYLV